MTGIDVDSGLSMKQIEGISGGDVLRDRAIVKSSEEKERSSKAWGRGSRRLLAALKVGPPRSHLALPLMILLGQQRDVIATRTEGRHVKLISEMYDKCQEACKQYILFLQKALSDQEYEKMLPTIQEARNTLGLDSEVVFGLYRPLLRRHFFAEGKSSGPAQPAEEGELEEGEERARDAVMEGG